MAKINFVEYRIFTVLISLQIQCFVEIAYLV